MSTMESNQIRDSVKCSCKGSNLDKLLQPSILTILSTKSMHGYLIIQKIEEIHIGEKPDNAGVYRMLKAMEEKGLIQFEWQTDDTGTPKKIYSISELGRECLKQWVKTLQEYNKTIDVIIKDARQALLQWDSIL